MKAVAGVMASLAAVMVMLCGSQSSVAAMTFAPSRICVFYISQVDMSLIDMRVLEREANQIWAPYGIAIEGVSSTCSTPGDGPILKVRVRQVLDARPVGIPRGTLGNIYFVEGKPTPLIDLWADEALRVMGGNPVHFSQGLPDPRVRVELGRLLGRSLAHELGHYLTGTRDHTEDGLMRASYGQLDGKGRMRRAFSLDADQVMAVERTVSAWRLARLVDVGDGPVARNDVADHARVRLSAGR